MHTRRTLRDPSKREQYDMLFSRGSRGRFDGSYHDTFSGSNNRNHDPFTEFHRHNDGHFSSKFYKIFSEVFQQETNMRANDIEVGEVTWQTQGNMFVPHVMV